MTNYQTTNTLEMRWVPVADDRGRERLEAVWIDLGAINAPSAAPSAASHAA